MATQTSNDPPADPGAERPHRRSALGLCVVLAVIVAGGYVAWHERLAQGAARPAAPPPAVPVETAAADQRDVPRYLTGIGTVQAFNTVSIKSRVDGELDRVAFVEGQTVQIGDLLAQLDPRPFEAALNQAIAKKAQDDASLANARLDLQRFATLAAKEYATQKQLDTQKALVAQLEAEVRGDQAAIDNARTQLGYTKITAPISGRTGIRLIDPGNIVHEADTTGIVIVTQLQPISVIFTLPEDDLAQVKAAMAAGPVKIYAVNRDGTKRLSEGTLALIDNEIDQTTGTIRLKGTFPNKDEALWPGAFVDMRLLADTYRNVITVPSSAVQRGPQGYHTYVVKPDATVEFRQIETGQIADGRAVVQSGVAAGEQVVVAGQYRLLPGARVQATKARPPSAASDLASTP